MNSKKKFYLFSVLVAIAVVMVATGVSYAYFTASISGSANSEVVTAGTMSITYSEGSSINLSNAYPGDSVTKTFSIENTGSLATTYTVYLSEVLNEFVDKTDLAYTLVSNDANVNIASTQVPSDSSAIVENKSIGVGETHHYTLTITFLNKNEDQNDNQGANFSAKLSVNEYRDYPIAKLASGAVFNERIKLLTNPEVDSSDLEACNNNIEGCDLNEEGIPYMCGYYAHDITSIEVSDSAPQQGVTTRVVSSDDSAYEIVAWYDNGTIYLYSNQDKIYLNENPLYMFTNLNLTGVLDMSLFDTSKVTNMESLFSDLDNVTSINLGNNFYTSRVTNMSGMFANMYSLETLNLGSNFDTSNVTDMNYMFYDVHSLTALDLGDKFDTSNVTNMDDMFKNMIALTSLDLGDNFDTSNVTSMEEMFSGLNVITTLDLGDKFDTSRVTNMDKMFIYDYLLSTIYVSDSFDISSVTSGSGLFFHDDVLTGGSGTVVDDLKNGKTRARIDCGETSPGYFTYKGSSSELAEYCATAPSNDPVEPYLEK